MYYIYTLRTVYFSLVGGCVQVTAIKQSPSIQDILIWIFLTLFYMYSGCRA